MKSRAINHKVIALLKRISDENQIKVLQNTHIKVIGNYGGQERTFMLSSSPTNTNYLCATRSRLKRFLQSLDIKTNIQYPYF